MNKPKFKKLIRKYIAGKASAAEEDLLFRHFEALQKYKNWDSGLMGDEETVKKKLFANIQSDIDKIEGKRAFLFGKWKIAACIMILSISLLGFLYTPKILNSFHPAAALQKAAAKGQTAYITLNDGTNVWLNADSRLLYPSKFKGERREVTLVGEAYFEVAHQVDKPFIIHSGKLITQVLGTSFNIKAYENDPDIKVAVLTGKVGLRNLTGNQKAVFLTPNQEAVYNKAINSIAKQEVDASLSVSWKDGNFRFRNVPLLEVIKMLERSYNVQIHCDAGVEKCVIYADFTREQSIGRILYMLASSLNGEVTHKGDKHYYINGGGCS